MLINATATAADYHEPLQTLTKKTMRKPYRRVQLARLNPPQKKSVIRIEANVDDEGNLSVGLMGSTTDIGNVLFTWATKSDMMRNAIYRANYCLIQKEIDKRKEALYLEKCRFIINHHKPNDN